MKKLVWAAIAVFTIGFANAQTARFGIKGGLNVSTLTGDIENVDPKIGAHVGGLVEIKVANKFSIQPELLLSLQGAKRDYYRNAGGTRFYNEDKVNLTYINVPVIAKFYVIPSLSLEAGPQLGFLVDAQNKFTRTQTTGNSSSSFERKDDVKDNFRSVDAGFNLGASYFFTDHMFIQGRYTIGISSIDKSDYSDNEDFDNYDYDEGVHNGVFQVSFGYRF